MFISIYLQGLIHKQLTRFELEAASLNLHSVLQLGQNDKYNKGCCVFTAVL